MKTHAMCFTTQKGRSQSSVLKLNISFLQHIFIYTF